MLTSYYLYYLYSNYAADNATYGKDEVDRFISEKVKNAMLGEKGALTAKLAKLRSDTISKARESDVAGFGELVERFLTIGEDGTFDVDLSNAISATGWTPPKTMVRNIQDILELRESLSSMSADLDSQIAAFTLSLEEAITNINSELRDNFEAFCQSVLQSYIEKKGLSGVEGYSVAESYIRDVLSKDNSIVGISGYDSSGEKVSGSLAKMAGIVAALNKIQSPKNTASFAESFKSGAKIQHKSTSKTVGTAKEVLDGLVGKTHGSYAAVAGTGLEIAVTKALETVSSQYLNEIGRLNSDVESIEIANNGEELSTQVKMVGGDIIKNDVGTTTYSKADGTVLISDGKVVIPFGGSIKSFMIPNRLSSIKGHKFKVVDSTNFYDLLSRYLGDNPGWMNYVVNTAAARSIDSGRAASADAKKALSGTEVNRDKNVTEDNLNSQWQNVYDSVVAANMISIIAGGTGDSTADTALFFVVGKQVVPMEDIFASLGGSGDGYDYAIRRSIVNKKGVNTTTAAKNRSWLVDKNIWISETSDRGHAYQLSSNEKAMERSEHADIIGAFQSIKITVNLKDTLHLIVKNL